MGGYEAQIKLISKETIIGATSGDRIRTIFEARPIMKKALPEFQVEEAPVVPH
ncbi:MAG: hypothetical protein ACLUN9_10790 [Enterocloster aldenensis]